MSPQCYRISNAPLFTGMYLLNCQDLQLSAVWCCDSMCLAVLSRRVSCGPCACVVLYCSVLSIMSRSPVLLNLQHRVVVHVSALSASWIMGCYVPTCHSHVPVVSMVMASTGLKQQWEYQVIPRQILTVSQPTLCPSQGIASSLPVTCIAEHAQAATYTNAHALAKPQAAPCPMSSAAGKRVGRVLAGCSKPEAGDKPCYTTWQEILGFSRYR